MTALYLVMYFPQWGGLFAAAKPGVTELDYYLAEYTPEEVAAGLATASVKFAQESRSQRGAVKGGGGGDADAAPAPVPIVATSA